MTWKRNPWRRPPSEFGDHYFTLRTSKDPRDQAKSRELQRRSEASFQRLLLRYPELAITMKSIPNEQNGFLKWLDLSDKVKAASSESVPKITFPKATDDFLYQRAAWEKSLNPTVSQPTDFANIVKGEWNVMIPHNLLPTLMNTEDPHAVSDVG